MTNVRQSVHLQPFDPEMKIEELQAEIAQLRKVCENYFLHCRCLRYNTFADQTKCPNCQEAEKLLKK